MKIKIRTGPEAERALLFSSNLRFILRNGPIGTKELSRRIGVSSNTIGGYARGRVFPNEERIKEIADGLGITMDELFDDTYAPWKFGEPVE